MAVATSIGPYQIIRLLKRGGQGRVYLGYDRRLRRQVAIKIHPLPEDPQAREQVLQEAQQIAGIESPKIVQIYDVIESSNHLAMVMEYVSGCDLEEFLQAVRPSLAAVLTIGTDIAAALAIARQQHVIHGDVKAANILITTKGRAKLTDFGIARNERRAEPAAAGSLSALSPEQLRGDPLDVRTDLFALGCLLYRMLTGTQPFFRGDRLDPQLLLDADPQPLQVAATPDVDLPEELVLLVGELLQKDPGDRPVNTHRVRRLLRRARRGIPLSDGDKLLREARPLFRPESAEDLPLPIPGDLVQQGRSRIGSQASGWPGLILKHLGWPGTAAVAGLLASAVVGVTWSLSSADTDTVHIASPQIRVYSGAEFPPEISLKWLVEEIHAALNEELGDVRVSGSLIRHTWSAQQLPPADEQLQPSLRCSRQFCVLAITREWAGNLRLEQAMLFPDMPVGQWRAVLRDTTAALYE